MTSQTKIFGAMTTNIAAAIGVKQATQTVEQAEKTLAQQCDLQAEMAKQMGGLGPDAGKGLIVLQLHEAIDSANSAGQAIRDEAAGTLGAGSVGAAGCAFSGIGGWKMNENEMLSKDLDSANALDAKLTTFSGSASISTPASQDALDHVARWRGIGKEADFSTHGNDDMLDNEALAHIHQNPKIRNEIQDNLNKHRHDLELRKSTDITQRRNNLLNAVNQVSQAGSQNSSGGGQLAKATDTTKSQKAQAEAQAIQTAEQAVAAQTEAAKQAASTYQGEMADILKNIAFPA